MKDQSGDRSSVISYYLQCLAYLLVPSEGRQGQINNIVDSLSSLDYMTHINHRHQKEGKKSLAGNTIDHISTPFN